MMLLVNLHDVHKAYGDNQIIAGISFQLRHGERIGLVGPNGCGKTTLLKLILGQEEPDRGEVFLSKGLSMGYLSQKPENLKGTLFEQLQKAVSDVLHLKKEMALLEEKMARPGIQENKAGMKELIEKYGQLAHTFESREGYTLEKRLKEIARGLGFNENDFFRQVETFSGGEKTRVQLAALLLQEPDLLLLDEPTNNLDTEAVEWLESYLQSWPGALLVVSHDRFFLDRVAGGILALEKGKSSSYRGNYSAFVSLREQEQRAKERAYKKQEVYMQKELAYIRRAKGDERAQRQSQSRQKQLDKLELILNPGRREQTMKMRLDFGGRSGKVVAVLEDVEKYYGTKKVLEKVNLQLNWGDRVAVLGPNGAGKSTLLRLITGEEPCSKGILKIGAGVSLAYFDQEHKQLDENLTPLEIITFASGMTEDEARNYLGRYLFQGDDVFKKVKDFSGGEKSRLALARTALQKSNFLVLDEPTNHLDIKGIEELEAVLVHYPGTLLLVSHDRYFITRLATIILEVSNRRVKLYGGSYDYYLTCKAQEKEKAENELNPKEELLNRREQKEIEKQKRQEILQMRRNRRLLLRKLEELEEDIHAGEEKIARMEKQMATPGFFDDFSRAREVMDEFNALKKIIISLYEKWESLSLKLEEISQEEDKLE